MPIKICRKVVLEIEMYVDYDEDLSEEEVLQHVQESTSGQTIDRQDINISYDSESIEFKD